MILIFQQSIFDYIPQYLTIYKHARDDILVLVLKNAFLKYEKEKGKGTTMLEDLRLYKR